MIITVNKNLPYQILLGMCCAVPYLSNYELTFALWVFTIMVTFKKSYSVRFLKYILCFVAILLIAFISTDFEKSTNYFIIRDITYLLKPILGLLLGYQICRYIYKNAIQTIIYTGLGISIVHLLIILETFLIHHHISVALLRLYCGYFSDFEVYALILVLFHKNLQVQMSRNRFYILAITIGFSAFMYLSRTNFIQFVVLFLAMKGYFILNKRALVAITSVVIGTLVLYAVVLFINPKQKGSGFEEFLYKVKVAPTEPFKSKVNTEDYKDFNFNYRSVEIIFTRKQVARQGPQAMIFGCGLGSQIDLKQEVYLGDMKLQFISYLHNGFMTTYLKSGIIGMLLLAASLVLLIRQKKETIPINKQFNYLMIGTAIFLLVSNWVLMGYYFTQDSKSILVGLMFAYKEITARESRKNATLEQL